MEVTKQSEEFVRKFLLAKLPENRYFHNIDHARTVANAVVEIGLHCSVSKEELSVLTVAAWFHDTGYCFEYSGHENSSMDIAGKFLSSENCNEWFISKVLNCISATRYPQQPNGLLEQVICDADLYHFSEASYEVIVNKLRMEWARVLKKKYTDYEWNTMNLELLINHNFFTNYGKEVLEVRKQRNITMLKDRIAND